VIAASRHVNNKKLSYRRERARQLPTWRGLSSPAHSPSSPLATTMLIWSKPKPTTYTYVKRAVRKAHFKLNRAFKVIQGYPYLCRQESRTVYCRNVQLMPTTGQQRVAYRHSIILLALSLKLFLKLTKIWQRERSKFVDFNDPTQV